MSSSSDDEDEQLAAGISGSKRSSPQSVLPSTKRQRKQSLLPGQVIKVRMHNFMTYADATIEPGSRLNLVLGPNGTGKSSLVNALCLGLGGKTSLLGRADRISDFVRKGEEHGYTEITLSNGEGRRPLTIKRLMNSKDNSSKWLLNGAEKPQRDVLAAVAELKIQVDNLCQFLPQDKVVMFARLTPTELLQETEKAIGAGELYEIHTQLTAKKKSLNDTTQSSDVLDAELSRHKAANAAMERDVARLKERAEILGKVDILEDKLPWVRYNQAKGNYLECKDRMEDGKRNLQRKTDELSAQQGPLKERMEALKAFDARRKKARRESQNLELKVEKHFGECTDLTDQIDVDRDAVENLEEDVQAHEFRIETIEGKVAAHKRQIDEMPAPPQRNAQQEAELRRELVDLNSEQRSREVDVENLKDEVSRTQRELDRHRGRLQQMDSIKGRRLAALEQRNPGITEASRWVQEHQTHFRGRVHGPIICEVEVNNQLHASMLEQHVPMAQWLVFVTELKEDQDQLIKESRNWRFRPSVSCYADDVSAPILHPKGDASQFRQYGVEKTLDEVFEAPGLIKHNLKDEAAIHEAYLVGGPERDSNERMEQFLQSSGVRVAWSHDSQWRTNVSAYNSAARSQTVIPLRPARYLLTSGSTGGAERAQLVAQIEECTQALARLSAELAQAQQAHATASERHKKAREDVKALNDARTKHEKKLRDLRMRLKAEENTLEREKAKPDPRDQEPQLRAALHATVSKAADAAMKAAEATKEMWGNMREEAHLALSWQQLESIVAALRKDQEGQAKARESAKTLLDRLTNIFEEAKETLRSRKAAAEEKAGEMTEELKARFKRVEEYGSSAEEILHSIATLQGEADGIVCGNPRVMEEYKDRVAKIAGLEERLQEAQELTETRAAEIKALEGKWLPELRRIVATVNATFGRAFAKIGCAGEVVLHLEDDYERCAINIKVKFREAEELQVLTAQRQSGGERSVSTILYLVALQNVAACPFRVVDEINQGMDPYNERKVFLELVSAATEEGTPQCFLLTPKLLPDLPFSPDVTVLQIMNGPQIGSIARGFTPDMLFGCRTPLIAAH